MPCTTTPYNVWLTINSRSISRTVRKLGNTSSAGSTAAQLQLRIIYKRQRLYSCIPTIHLRLPHFEKNSYVEMPCTPTLCNAWLTTNSRPISGTVGKLGNTSSAGSTAVQSLLRIISKRRQLYSNIPTTHAGHMVLLCSSRTTARRAEEDWLSTSK